MVNARTPAIPKHAEQVPQAQEATSPYNFVPLPEVVVRAVVDAEGLPNHDTYDHPNFPNTGYFDVTLVTRSPLYIRGPLTRQEYDFEQQGRDRYGKEVGNNHPFADLVKNKAEFFHTGTPGQPVVPGSSLRGMLRNLLEIVSYGKVRWGTDKRLFFRTVDDSAVGLYYNSRMVENLGTVHSPLSTQATGYRARVKAGWLRKQRDGSWYIEECNLARLEISDIKAGLGLTYTSELYSNQGRPVTPPTNLVRNPNLTPNWSYQHKDIWVHVGPEADHFFPRKIVRGRPIHPNLYLRYSKATSPSTTNNTGDKTRGTLVITGPMQRKHMEFVFIKKDNPGRYKVPNDPREEDINRRLVDLFHDGDQVTRWQRLAFPKDRPRRKARDADGFLQQDGEPVFFLLEKDADGGEGLTFFGRAQMFRLPYQNRPVDLVPEELRRPEDIDYADAICGFVRTRAELDDMKRRGLDEPKQGTKGRAYAGRVFVTDAGMVEAPDDDPWLSQQPFPPRILASPKPTAFQHYLVQPSGSTAKDSLRHYDSNLKDDAATAIRGHKRYWLQGNPGAEQLKPEPDSPNTDAHGIVRPNSTQHTMLKPVRDGVKFRFRVYFENLSHRELGALAWVLQPLGESSADYCHQLGMGKPLGMGAVKLDATLHLTNRHRRYSVLFDPKGNWETGESQPPVRLADRSALEKLVKDFEQHLLGELQPNPQCQHLYGMKRIAMLLKMMEWPGQDPAKVRDMGLERHDRPVLPPPSAYGQLAGQSEPGVTSVSLPETRPANTITLPPSNVAEGSRPNRQPRPNQIVTLITDESGGKARVRTEEGAEVECSDINPFFRLTAGARIRVSITFRDGQPASARFRGRV